MTQAKQKTALIMAGGTGGHIFPGLAVAQALQARGWQVHWLGAAGSMEARISAEHGIPLEVVDFAGVRGKGFKRLLTAPWQLLRAVGQSRTILRRLQPSVVIGFGGYISVPAGLAARMGGRPLFLHEQNAIAGMSNRLLSHLAQRVFTAFPQVLPQGEWVGNPLRAEFTAQTPPQERLAQRSGPLRLLVLGGSLGAKALNTVLPQALALIPEAERPIVVHQSGEKQIAELQANYAAAGVQAELLPFIHNVAERMAEADLLVCRAGASTVCEIAALGAAAIFVPFPFAVDDHQTANARFLSEHGGGILWQQNDLDAAALAQRLQALSRTELSALASAAQAQAKLGAAQRMAQACEGL